MSDALVELVDPAGAGIGVRPVTLAHRPPGLLHRAFSVVLFDDAGRVLLQRRAAVKTRFALRWANTVCGHPAPGAPVVGEAQQRLKEELGIDAVLSEVGTFVYQADDEAGVFAEHEYDHVVVGRWSDAALDPDPAEVAEVRWLPGAAALAAARTDPAFAPWAAQVLELALRAREYPFPPAT